MTCPKHGYDIDTAYCALPCSAEHRQTNGCCECCIEQLEKGWVIR